MRPSMFLSAFVLASALCAAAAPVASAQQAPGRSALEIAFDHGIAQLREPGEQIEWTGAQAALHTRVLSPSGFGAMIRAGTTLGTILTFELDAGPAYRAWIVQNGPRGLTLGGSVGASVFWKSLAPRVGVDTSLAAGAHLGVQLDYHEHGFVVGIGYLARWLPLREHGDGLDTFSFAATARVGGEIDL